MDNPTKWCPGCEIEKPVGEFYVNVARPDGLSGLCRACHIADTNARARRQRLQAIEVLGGRCVSPTCSTPGGMTDQRALQFDHISGGGHQRRLAGEHIQAVVKAILAGSTDFQLLCANCNYIKRDEMGEWGEKGYQRPIPTERKRGVGKGRASGQQDGVRNWWATATPEQRAARVAASAAGRKGKANPKMADARRGTKLVDGHWVRPGDPIGSGSCPPV